MCVSSHAFGVRPSFNALAPTPATSVTDRIETILASRHRLKQLKQFSQQDFTKPSADVCLKRQHHTNLLGTPQFEHGSEDEIFSRLLQLNDIAMQSSDFSESEFMAFICHRRCDVTRVLMDGWMSYGKTVAFHRQLVETALVPAGPLHGRVDDDNAVM